MSRFGPNILIVDDEPAIRRSFGLFLSDSGYTTRSASNMAQARLAIAEESYDAVLLDMVLPDGNGLDLVDELRASNPGMAIIIITAHGEIPVAVEAMRRGADNFLTKPVNLSELEVCLSKFLEIGRLRRSRDASLKLAGKSRPYFGESSAIKRVLDVATVASSSDAPVMIQGETGVGKGLLARWIHDNSPRRDAPFVELNCSMLGGDLLASELFGHARGSFTSAVSDRQGLLDLADGGTLFLDEIGDMDLNVQGKFLKVVEEKMCRRVGDVRSRRSDFRLICATNKNLSRAVKQGAFRVDLFYRIYVIPIEVPSLRERMHDLSGLAAHILRDLGRADTKLPDDVLELLMKNHWSGNVRALRNALERAHLLSSGGDLRPEHFSGILDIQEPSSPASSEIWPQHREIARIRAEIKRAGGSVEAAARELGMSRATLYRRLKKLRESGLDV